MRVIVIVTHPIYELWKIAAEQDWKSITLGSTRVLTCDYEGDKAIILHQATADHDEQVESTTEFVNDVLRAVVNDTSQQKVFIAAHAGYVNFQELRKAHGNERIVACASFSHYPEAPGQDELSDALYGLAASKETAAFQSTLEEIQKAQVLTHSQRLSTLKHRLAHLFLPIVVDLDAWREFDFDDDYMQEILSSNRCDEERLDRARALVYEGAALPTDDSVEKIVTNADRSEEPSWLTVQSLLPPGKPESEEEKEKAKLFVTLFEDLNVLGCLKDRDQLEKLRVVLRDQNPLGEWCRQLDATLSELRGKLD